MNKAEGYVVNPEQRLMTNLFEALDGPARGMRMVEISNSAGLLLHLMPDRALDIGPVMYRGGAAAWLSPSGTTAPGFYDPNGLGWLRTFPGGFLTTCGLSQAGAPCEEDGVPYGLHGRIAHIPADKLSINRAETKEGLVAEISGTAREGVIFGECFTLKRTVSVPENSAEIRIIDTIRNERTKAFPLMLLYHFNLGHPLIQKGSRVIMPEDARCTPRDKAAEKGIKKAQLMEEPQAGYGEQVFLWDVPTDKDGFASLAVENPDGFRAELCYDKEALPYLAQWKMMGEGDYVLGIEPGNCFVLGRAEERKAGRLKMLEGGEILQTSLTWRFSIKKGGQ